MNRTDILEIYAGWDCPVRRLFWQFWGTETMLIHFLADTIYIIGKMSAGADITVNLFKLNFISFLLFSRFPS